MVLPVITGFDYAAPKSIATIAREAIPAPTLQPPQPTAPETPGTALNWRRDKDLQTISAEPGAATTKADFAPEVVLSWETGAGKSYFIPALEVPGFLCLLNVYDRIIYSNDIQDGKKVYSSTFSSTWEHLSHQNWVFDKDPFNVNQFAHPYQGATMYGLARSSGLSFWESLA